MSEDHSDSIASEIFSMLVGEDVYGSRAYVDGKEIRSLPSTNYVDVLRDGQWHRITVDTIDEPLSEESHEAMEEVKP